MDTKIYEYFMRVAELRSLSRAAEDCDVSQPTLSRHIRRLEQELGVELFTRGARGVTLTEFGRKLYAETGTILNQLQTLRERVAPPQGSARGHVSIAATPDISDSLLPPLVGRYLREYPYVSISITQGFSGSIEAALLCGGAEIGVMPMPDTIDATLVTERLCIQRAFLVGPGEVHGAMQASYTVSQLRDLPMILPGRHHSLRANVERATAACGFTPRIAVEVEGLTAIKALVRHGVGYSVLTYSGIAEELRMGTLRAAPITHPVIERTFVIATRQRPPLSAPARLLLRGIRASVGERVRDGSWPNTRLPDDE